MIRYFCDLCEEETDEPTGKFIVGPVKIVENYFTGKTIKYDGVTIIDNVCSLCREEIDEYIGGLADERRVLKGKK